MLTPRRGNVVGCLAFWGACLELTAQFGVQQALKANRLYPKGDDLLTLDEDEARASASRLADISPFGVLHIDHRVATQFRKMGGQGCGIEQGFCRARLVAPEFDDDVGARAATSVKPTVVWSSVVEREAVVVRSALTDPNLQAIQRRKPAKRDPVDCRAPAPLSSLSSGGQAL